MRKFDSSKSSTYQKTNYTYFGSSENGVYGQDFIRFGNPGTNQLVIPNAIFGQDKTTVEAGVADGIMSLGFAAQNDDGVDPPIITAINAGILDSPVVTIFLKSPRKSPQTTNFGVITYGAVDTVNCDRNVIYESIAEPNKFIILLQNVSLGATQFADKWLAHIDTTSPFMMASQYYVDAFTKEVNAVFSSNYNTYVIDCNAKFNFNFVIGSRVYTLTEKEMIIEYGNNVCLFAMLPVDDPSWVLGYPWFRAYCNILDYSNKRVGFANIIN